MMTVVTQVTRVLPGHRVEIVASELVECKLVGVLGMTRSVVNSAAQSLIGFLDSLPAGPRAAGTWSEYEQHLRDEKEAWR